MLKKKQKLRRPDRYKVGDLVAIKHYTDNTGLIVEAEHRRYHTDDMEVTYTLYHVLVTTAMSDHPYLDKVFEDELSLVSEDKNGENL